MYDEGAPCIGLGRSSEPGMPSMSQALKERGEVIAQQEARIKELSEELEGARADSPPLELDLNRGD